MSQDTAEFTITDGMCEYKHSKPLGDYDNKTPVVRLNYTIAEGADPALATAKVMGIAMEIVERAIATNVTVQQAELSAEIARVAGLAREKVRRGRPPLKPTGGATDPDMDNAMAASIIEEPSDPASMAGIDSVDEDVELGLVPTEQQVETVGDTELQAQAQKVSGHLRKEFQNINDLRKLIASCQAEGTENGTLLTIPADKRYDFMQKSKGLLAMKK